MHHFLAVTAVLFQNSQNLALICLLLELMFPLHWTECDNCLYSGFALGPIAILFDGYQHPNNWISAAALLLAECAHELILMH